MGRVDGSGGIIGMVEAPNGGGRGGGGGRPEKVVGVYALFVDAVPHG